jgi:hypothetical protein
MDQNTRFFLELQGREDIIEEVEKAEAASSEKEQYPDFAPKRGPRAWLWKRAYKAGKNTHYLWETMKKHLDHHPFISGFQSVEYEEENYILQCRECRTTVRFSDLVEPVAEEVIDEAENRGELPEQPWGKCHHCGHEVYAVPLPS